MSWNNNLLKITRSITVFLTKSERVFYTQKGIHQWMVPQVALDMVSNKGSALLQLSGVVVPAQSWCGADLSTVLAAQSWQHSPGTGQCGPDLLPQSQVKTTGFHFLAPVSSCQNHTPSNDVRGMELKSARNSIPLFSARRALTNT